MEKNFEMPTLSVVVFENEDVIISLQNHCKEIFYGRDQNNWSNKTV